MSAHDGVAFPALTIRSVGTTPVLVPMNFALGTSAARVTEAPLLLINLETEEGVTGRTYLFCYRPSGARAIALPVEDAASLIKGEQARPADIASKLARNFALIGVTGAVRMALSGLDAAMWDALAIAAGLPLASMLGSAPRPVRAYNSCGLGLMAPSAVADEAERLVKRGFKAIKLRLGYPTLAEDLSAFKAVRKRVGAAVAVMVDYNQALSVEDALLRAPALASEGAAWLEEPIRHDDLEGNAKIAAASGIPLQIGGVTGWIQAAALAAAHRVPMSSHLFPKVSAHLLAATPTADWLEYVDWADAIVQEPLKIVDDMAVPPDRPGSGLDWDVRAVERYRMS